MDLGYYAFQQDNDPKHTAKLAKKFFAEKNVDVLIWPAQSPDLNPIESLWEIIKSKVAKYAPKSISELKAIIERKWYATPIKLCKKLALSFKGRSCDVYRANGGHINY
jgi:transposase